jgi:hypothetical protein
MTPELTCAFAIPKMEKIRKYFHKNEYTLCYHVQPLRGPTIGAVQHSKWTCEYGYSSVRECDDRHHEKNLNLSIIFIRGTLEPFWLHKFLVRRELRPRVKFENPTKIV